MAKKTAYRQVDRVIDYKEVFGSVAGKNVLHDMAISTVKAFTSLPKGIKSE